MNMPTILKESKRLKRADKEKLIIETVKDLDDFQDLEDAIDVIKSKNEKKIDWESAKTILLNLGKI